MVIREESTSDVRAIGDVIQAAFASAPHSDGTEHLIVDRLRADQALATSLVASEGLELVGYVACSPVTVGGAALGWYGLGPVAVRPDRQGRGIGQALVNSALERLKEIGAAGCVLLGEPDYYGRFGFRQTPELWLAGVPPEYFLALALSGRPVPAGEVVYHPAFGGGERA